MTQSNEVQATKTVKQYEASIKAMNDTKGAIEYAIEALETDTLKKIKDSLITVTSQAKDLPIMVKDSIKALDSKRTKKDYIEGLGQVTVCIDDTTQVAVNAVRDIVEANIKAKKAETSKTATSSKQSKPELDQNKLDTLASDIREAIAQKLKFHFEAGKLLSEALEMFKASGKPAKDWLAWANTACNVKKAQAYNLVKVWNDFGGVSEFEGCSMRVLNILVHTSNDVYKKIEEQAKALAKKGKLDTKAVNSLLRAVTPVSKPATSKPATSKPATSKPATTEPETPETPDNTTQVIQDSIKSQDSPELGTSKDEVADSTRTNQMDELIKQNQELLNKISELESKLAKQNKTDAPAKTAVFLPQFESSEPYLVLGISPVANKAEINKRYRSMADIFNAKTCPKGAKALKAAKEAMLKNCE